MFWHKSQLAKVIPTYSSSSRLPECFPGICLRRGGGGGVLFIISHNPRSHTEHIQGLLSTARIAAHVSREECKGGTWLS